MKSNRNEPVSRGTINEFGFKLPRRYCRMVSHDDFFQPYLKFINLRKETLRLVALYEPRFAYPRWFAPVDDERRRP